MIRPQKVLEIARFEIAEVVLRWRFVLVTFGLPLFFAGTTGFSAFLQSATLAESLGETVTVGVVDEGAVVFDGRALEASQTEAGLVIFERFSNEEEAAEALSRLNGGVYIVPPGYMETGAVQHLSRDTTRLISSESHRALTEPVFATLLREVLVTSDDPDVRTRILTPMELERTVLGTDGVIRDGEAARAQRFARTTIPILLAMLLVTALLFSSGYLVQTVATDKETKMVEVLLSILDPSEVLFGKLLGLGAAGLIQFGIWVFLGGGVFIFAASFLPEGALELPWLAIALAPIFLVLGYFFFGSLMLATGSLGTDMADAQKLSMGWAILAIVPLLSLTILLEHPSGGLAKFFCAVPFFSPVTFVMRLALDPAGVSAWDYVVAILSLLVGTWLALRIGARLFRIGMLTSSGRPSLRELWNQARLLE